MKIECSITKDHSTITMYIADRIFTESWKRTDSGARSTGKVIVDQIADALKDDADFYDEELCDLENAMIDSYDLMEALDGMEGPESALSDDDDE